MKWLSVVMAALALSVVAFGAPIFSCEGDLGTYEIDLNGGSQCLITKRLEGKEPYKLSAHCYLFKDSASFWSFAGCGGSYYGGLTLDSDDRYTGEIQDDENVACVRH